MRTCLLSALFLSLSAFVSGCAGSGESACTVGADCASGRCNVDGTCAPEETSSASSGQGGEASGSGGSGQGGASSASTSSGGGSGVGGSNTCSPNNDGTIERFEIPLQAGLHATFLTAQSAPVDTAGATQPGGDRVWDLTGALPGDHASLVETLPLAGQWFEGTFPGASYASRLADTEDLLGVFEITNDALLLRGVVSPLEGFDKTELTYSPPVKVLEFPLHEGDSFATNATVTGTAQGVTVFFSELYDSKVDAHGTMKTPYGDFQVLRIGVDLTRTVGLLVTVVRSYLFTAECFGTVASIRSNDNELGSEFTTAAEVRRLTP